MLFSDTVGFINKLPHDLVNAFRSTLEEVSAADIILHIVDCSSSYYDKQMSVVEDVLSSLGAAETPRINVYHKIDKLDSLPTREGACLISAATGAGMDKLISRIEAELAHARVQIDVVIPYDKYEAASFLRAEGTIMEETHEENGTRVRAQLDESSLWKLKKLLGDNLLGDI